MVGCILVLLNYLLVRELGFRLMSCRWGRGETAQFYSELLWMSPGQLPLSSSLSGEESSQVDGVFQMFLEDSKGFGEQGEGVLENCKGDSATSYMSFWGLGSIFKIQNFPFPFIFAQFWWHGRSWHSSITYRSTCPTENSMEPFSDFCHRTPRRPHACSPLLTLSLSFPGHVLRDEEPETIISLPKQDFKRLDRNATSNQISSISRN